MIDWTYATTDTPGPPTHPYNIDLSLRNPLVRVGCMITVDVCTYTWNTDTRNKLTTSLIPGDYKGVNDMP